MSVVFVVAMLLCVDQYHIESYMQVYPETPTISKVLIMNKTHNDCLVVDGVAFYPGNFTVFLGSK